MKISRTIALVLFAIVQTGVSQSLKYYVDAASGYDGNDGLSPAKAWKTLAKVSVTQFQPGDSVLFKAGLVWIGQLVLQGSGAKEAPIVVDMYGGSVKPRLDGNGVVGTATVYLNNGKFWEINNLEITNNAATEGDRRGVLVSASNFGLVQHIYLRNLDIHDVRGIVGDDDAQKRTAGIGIEVNSDNLVPTRFDDLLIEGCTIYSVDNTGLYTDCTVSGARTDYPGTGKWPARSFSNARIRNNIIHHIAKNAMIIRLFDKGVIEYNTCYETALKTTGNTMFSSSCDGTVFQFNEGYFNRSSGSDGSMYDADLRSPNTIWQYSYSHDNAHGLFWTCTNQADTNVVCRYNISQNDKGIIFCINYPNTSVYCYNNTVYCGSGIAPTIISERNVNTGTRAYYFYNNVIYSDSPNAKYDFRSSGYTRTIDYNVFFGYHPSNEPADFHKLTSDPQLVNPGGGGTGIHSVDGYKLKPTSPCIRNGILISGNGGLDYWGNSVSPIANASRGANEVSTLTGVNERGAAGLQDFALSQNYPNPFNPSTSFEFRVSSFGFVSLSVFDVLGREVATLVHDVRPAGVYNVRWDATAISSGVYFYRLRASDCVETKKMVFTK
jgi:hypothetical protein